MEKYEKIRMVGRGASGTVYLYRRKSDGKLIIIKQIPVEQMSKEERLSALNEGRVLSMLHHPNIIEYYESFLQDKAMMIVMEYAPGGTLHDFLQEKFGQLLNEEEILKFFAQMLLSLQHVHSRQILHRDLKTQNILLDKRRKIVKIGDFGISKILTSKSKAYTVKQVVGTPCYISPELCEGKPNYNQKSDIWALGCILYELVTLKKAFEAPTLPALILKILSGTIVPIANHYSENLKQLISSLLCLDPNKRPSISQVMAHPLVMNAVANFHTDNGMIVLGSQKNRSASFSVLQVVEKTTNTQNSDLLLTKHDGANSCPYSSVFCWGGGIRTPLALPNLYSEVTSVTTGRVEKHAVTQSGRVIVWEKAPGSLDKCPPEPTYFGRFLDGLSALRVVQVACQDLFTICLTDRGIVLTCGSGVNGCLGHGDASDVSQPKIVESLLGFEVTRISCGSSHVIAVTNDHEVFAWGRGDNSRLGLGTNEPHAIPCRVPLPPDCWPKDVYCGLDCLVLLTIDGKLFACGNNSQNKLLLGDDINEGNLLKEVNSELWNEETIAAVALGTLHTAILTETGRLHMAGSNQFGQLKNSCDLQPFLEENERVTHVACGDAFTVIATSGGKILSWGKSSRGRLGCNKIEEKGINEVKLPGFTHPKVLSMHSCHGNTIVLSKEMVI